MEFWIIEVLLYMGLLEEKGLSKNQRKAETQADSHPHSLFFPVLPTQGAQTQEVGAWGSLPVPWTELVAEMVHLPSVQPQVHIEGEIPAVWEAELYLHKKTQWYGLLSVTGKTGIICADLHGALFQHYYFKKYSFFI